MILVQKLPGKKTVFSKSLYFTVNQQLLLCTGSTLFQRALDVALLSHCFLEEDFWKELSEVDAVLQACDITSFLLLLLVFSLQPPVCMTTCRALHKLFWLPGEISTHTFLLGQQAECWARGLSIASTSTCKQGVRNLLLARNLHMTSNACCALDQPSDLPSEEVTAVSNNPPSAQRRGLSSFGQGFVTRAPPLPSCPLPCSAPFSV